MRWVQIPLEDAGLLQSLVAVAPLPKDDQAYRDRVAKALYSLEAALVAADIEEDQS